jgi:hypothetical protein
MRGWTIRILAVALCLCLALPALASADEPVMSKYNVKIWGRVKMDYSYDTAQFVDYNDFLGVPADSAITTNQKNNSTNFNPRDTRLGFSASHAVDSWAGKGVVEIDFYGDKQASGTLIPRMRLAYADLANKDWGTSVRAGQDWTPVLSTNPSTIDFGILSATGNLWWRRPQLTVRQNLDMGDTGGLQLLASAMLGTRTSTASESRFPWMLGRAAYSFDMFGGKHMVAGDIGYQHDRLAASGAGHGPEINRWLAGGEFKFDFNPFLLKGEIWTGQAIGGDFLRYNLDTYVNDDGDTKEWKAWGGWVDLTYKIMPKWSVTAGIGYDNPSNSGYRGGTYDPDEANPSDRVFLYAYNAYVNTWYTLGSDVKVGFEVMNLTAKRQYADNTTYRDKGQRYTMSLYYGF